MYKRMISITLTLIMLLSVISPTVVTANYQGIDGKAP